jgi:hypothetical protein
MTRAVFLAISTALLACAIPAGAQAGATMKIGVDDDRMMQRLPGGAPTTAAEWRNSGVDQSRLSVVWSRIAPNATSVKRPAGFDARDPESVGYDWAEVDAAVTALNANGIKIELLVTTPAPIWASEVPSRREPTYRPDAEAFADFVHAVAVRYGTRIASYTLINEPNLWQWLTPQWSCSGAAETSCRAVSPAIYRELFRAGHEEIKAVSPRIPVWGGSLAPLGTASRGERHSSLGPLYFLRRLGCVKENYARDRSSTDCRAFKPLTFDAIAHHPHSSWLSPRSSNGVADSVTIGTIPRLTKAVDRIQARGGLLNGLAVASEARRKPLDLQIDEFGFQTNPPDAWSGVSLARQDDYLQEAAYMMWKNSRVKLFSQYLWRDEPLDKITIAAGSWQSGLYFEDGTAKPAARSFLNPFWVDLPRHSRQATVWGQVRPGSQTEVKVQSRPVGLARYSALRSVTTNRFGYFSFKVAVKVKTAFRFYYGSDAVVTSSVRTVKPS